MIQGFQKGSRSHRQPGALRVVWSWPAELGVMWALCVGQSSCGTWLYVLSVKALSTGMDVRSTAEQLRVVSANSCKVH